ncbi:peroxiredoxin [Saonia flava]|uniref:Peroxiredoxin n=1 Tax=Saonia flava TaxID=523696 RepID=A0A846QS49_9FLAO|nr:TlpA disulfide reductase family protein [Saonia flava]NJB70027.1 peroxiredoxin [Saonia flava]
MKKLVFFLSILSFFMACTGTPEGFTLEGTLTGELEEGTLVYLKKAEEGKPPADIDTATIENGKFLFTGGIQESPEVHYVAIDKVRGFIPIILENGEIVLEAQKDSIAFAKIKGTVQNDIFADYLEKSRAMSGRVVSMQNDMRSAQAAKDTATMNSLRDEYFELQEEAKNFEMDFIKNNPNALITALLIDKALGSKALSEEELKEMFESLTPEIKATSVGKSLMGKLKKAETTTIGSKAPNFSAPTPTGEKLALNDVLGKITIVDFWAAWCRPCRAENPNVVNVYNKYHDKGLKIMGVSLDKSAEEWIKAINDDGLVWDHVSNVNYFDEIAALYNVNAIPASFILDENGVIVAKNLRGQALEEKIAELLQ